MNNAKLWLVVKPTTGIPIFLTAVAVGSLAVHVAIVTNTSWVGDFLSGDEMGSTASLTIDQPVKTAAMPAMEGDRITVTLPDGRQAVAVIESPPVLAEARPGRSLTE
ncbi:MAG: light-harvesting protein [Pseudomonadota bacterium]